MMVSLGALRYHVANASGNLWSGLMVGTMTETFRGLLYNDRSSTGIGLRCADAITNANVAFGNRYVLCGRVSAFGLAAMTMLPTPALTENGYFASR